MYSCPTFCYGVCLLLANLLLNSTQAQDASNVQPIPETVVPKPATKGLILESCGIAPQSNPSPDGILGIRCLVRNTSDTTLTGYLSGRVTGNLFDDDRRRVEVPGNTVRAFELPVRLPSPLPDSGIDASVSLTTIVDGKEVLVLQGEEPASKSVRYWKPGKNPVVAAIAMGREPEPILDWRWGKTELFSTYELAVASRVDAEMSKDCIALEATPFPLSPIDWKALDTVILADPRPLADGATLSVLKDFLHSGGKVWVMLDGIDTAVVEPLLEQHQQCTTIETIELRSFRVDIARRAMSDTDRTVELTDDVPFKCVQTTGASIPHSIDGWPASLIFPIGRGELILTTLHSSAWIQPRRAQWSDDPLFQSDFELRPWAMSLVDIVHTKRAAPLLGVKDIDYPLQRIGNPVLPRRLVISILASFCGALMLYGLWSTWVGQMRGLGWVAPILAVATALPLASMAWMQRKDIPPTVASFQTVQFENPSGGILRESAAVYTPEPAAMSLESNRGGFAHPDRGMQHGVKTLTTEDFQSWKMTNVAWPTGTWRYTSEVSLPDLSVVARGNLDATGLHITVPNNLPSRIADPVLAYLPGAPVLGVPGASKDGHHSVLFNGDYPAEGERWTLNTIVDAEQSRRAAIYQKLLDSSDRLNVQTRTLFGWTDLFDAAPQWNTPLDRRGVALVALPVELETPTVGQQVLIPYSLISLKNAEGVNSSPIFMESTGKWVTQSSSASESQIEFHLPREVVPLETSRIELSWDVSAPRRSVSLACVRDDGSPPVALLELDEPSLPINTEITQRDVLDDFRDGRATFRIIVSADKQAGGSLPWRIRSLRMTVHGRTLPRHAMVRPDTNRLQSESNRQ